MTIDKAAVLQAVQELADMTNPARAVEIVEDVARFALRYPVKLTGELAGLNPLLKLAMRDPGMYQTALGLVDKWRAKNGLPPVKPPPEPKAYDKTESQRQLMAMRRRLAGRAIEMDNQQRPEADRLKGPRRMEAEGRWLKKQGDRLREIEARARDAAGGVIPKAQLAAIKEKFWSGLDAELDERAEQLRQELQKPAHQRRKV